jgi:putative transposase
MPRAPRIDVGGEIYHVINRANGRFNIFESDAAYRDFEILLKEMQSLYDMRILAYVLMPNHWHMLLYPKHDGDLAKNMRWLGTTHTRRFHTQTNTVGMGHLYQGRYKSFLVEGDRHLLTVLKYIERNPVRAKLAIHVEDWQWGSAYHRTKGTLVQKELLAEIPTDLPRNYHDWINMPEPSEELDLIRKSIAKGIPYGGELWRDAKIKRYSLAQTLRLPGRPTKY